MTSPTNETHTCANCFAEFEWTPFNQDGEDFCCSGCADGGPCICTYDGASDTSGPAGPAVVAAVPGSGSGSESDGSSEGEVPSDKGNDQSGGSQPPSEPPSAPTTSPGDAEPPADGRLAVIMAAISEMPLPVQEVVRARLANEGTEEEIGEPLGLAGDEVRQFLEQGQAILDRSVGPEFQIRYIGVDEPVPDESLESESSLFDADEPARAESSVELSRIIAQSVEAIATAAVSDAEEESPRDVLAEALREASALFRLAAERMDSEDATDVPLRVALAGSGEDVEPVTLIVIDPTDISRFLVALQSIETVRWTRIEQLTANQAVLQLVIDSMTEFVRKVVALEASLKPTRLQISGRQVTVELPDQLGAADIPSAPNGASGGPHTFEMSVDAFFGARHFIETKDGQSTPHHHSYRVEGSFLTSEPNGYGFVVGFAEMREVLESTVMDYSETLLNTQEPFLEVPPTTENLARVFHEKVTAKLQSLNEPGVQLKHIRVWESPTNSATYSDIQSNAAVTA